MSLDNGPRPDWWAMAPLAHIRTATRLGADSAERPADERSAELGEANLHAALAVAKLLASRRRPSESPRSWFTG